MDVKYIAGSTIGSSLTPGVYEVSDINLMLESLFPGNVKVNVTVDGIRLKSNLTTKKKQLSLVKKIFSIYFYLLLNPIQVD